jgi:EAL domain-containing protein (putative c-di-GMP-specific phosphodiesterase class I)
MCEDLNTQIIAEGVETMAERDVLASYGITLFQGYLFCKPSFKSAGSINQEAML